MAGHPGRRRRTLVDLVEDEMTEAEFGSRKTWILTEDLDALQSAPTPKGKRLLPPRDPYTQLRDRESIIDKQFHRDVWRIVGDPGTVLVDGEIAGVWRPRKSGRKLTITVKSFGSLPAQNKKPLQAEVEQVATLRGASSVDVEFDSY